MSDVQISDLTKRIGEGGDLSGLDKQLLEMASKRFTPEQMSEELGGVISAPRCAQRVKEILKSQDWLSVVEMQAVLLNDMYELKDILFDRIRNEGGYEIVKGIEQWVQGDPRWSANLIRLFKEFREIVNDSRGEVEKQRDMIREAHAQLMFRGMELTFDRLVFMVEQAQANGETVNRTAMLEMMETALPIGMAAITEKVSA